MIKDVVKPNLFIIGAMKSGTTSLHNYLKGHPKIFMSEPKELWYFVEEKNWYKGKEWYLDHFRNVGQAEFIGESSADYTMYPIYKGVPEKICHYNPNAKLIYLMRDPVERAISHYWYDVRIGYEKRPIKEAIFSEVKYLNISNYFMQLNLYFELFDHRQIYVETFEKMVLNPVEVVHNILAWLGLDLEEYNFQHIGKSYNSTPEIVEQVKGWGVLHLFRCSKFWDVLHPISPYFLIKVGKKLGYRQVNRKNTISKEIYDYLRDHLVENALKLENMLGRNFTEWNRTFA